MGKILNITKELCVGCRLCELACSLRKVGMFSPFNSAIWVYREDCKGIDFPVVCRQCKWAPCIEACPVEEPKPIVKDKQTGAVLILSDNGCIGCYECVRACPFGAIRIHPDGNQLVICDLCGGEPECVQWCPTSAISFVVPSLVGYTRPEA